MRLSRSYHRNVLKDGFACAELDAQQADAVFLDLPQPETAIAHAAAVLRVKGKLCSFSPCIEQISATVEALAKHGFGLLKTVECVERNYYRRLSNVRDMVTNADTKMESLQLGDRVEKTHTGYLLFATKLV